MKKQLLVILMITIVITTVFVAGCTRGVTNTTSPSPTPKSAVISMPTAKEFTDMWVRSHSNDTLVAPFTKSVNERGHVTFTGVTRGPYSHGDEPNIFELCKDKEDAQQTYQQIVNQASSSGYMFDSRELNTIQDKSTVVGWIPSNKALEDTIIIGWNSPDDYGVGYYIQTIKMLSPSD
jgi:hypothetical protein